MSEDWAHLRELNKFTDEQMAIAQIAIAGSDYARVQKLSYMMVNCG